MSDLVERLHTLSRGDHERGCQGREYHCSCGFDEQAWQGADEAIARITALEPALAEAGKQLRENAETLAQVPAAIAEARRQALEEAAKVAESLPVELPLMPGMADGASMATNQIARAIRDMKDRT